MRATEKPTILLAEGNEAVRCANSRLLDGAGCEIIEAATGEAALQAAAHERPDLIILNVELPGISGHEVCQRLKADPETGMLPVMCLSGLHTDGKSIADGLETGADICLTQPVDPPLFVATVRALLRARRAERLLEVECMRALEARLLAGILENTTAGMSCLDGDFRFVQVYPAFCRATGHCMEELMGRVVFEIFPGEELRAALEQARRTGEPAVFREFPYQFVDQPERGVTYWDWALTPIKDEQGRVERLVSSLLEVTDHVRARERIVAAERALTQEARLLETIVENTESQLAYLDLDFNFVRVNRAYVEACGHSREELIGRNHFHFFPNAANQAIFEWVRDSGEAVEFREKPFEYVDQSERGVTYWNWRLTPVKNEEGRVEGLVLSLTDMTEHVRARERLVAEERARARLAETLAAEISHSTKNNLAMVVGLLQMQIDAQPGGGGDARTLRDAIARIATFGAVHEQLYERRADVVELVDAMHRIADLARQALSMGDVEVSVEGERTWYPAKVATNICVVGNELLTNAIKHGAPGPDGRLRIRIGIGLRDGKFRLSVWNSGNPVPCGFDPRKQETMGLRLVCDMAERAYQGTFTVRPHEGGTLAEIVISDDRLRGEG